MLLKRTSQFFCSTVCLGESSDLFLSKAGLEKNYRGLVWAKAAWSAETLAVDWWWISSCGERTGGCFQGIFVAWCKSAQCQWHFQLAQGLRKGRCFFLQPRIWKKFTWLYGVLSAQTRQYATELHEGLARSLQEYLTTRPTTRSASKLGQSACTSRGHPNLFRLLDQMMSCFVWIPFSDFALPSHPAICHA